VKVPRSRQSSFQIYIHTNERLQPKRWLLPRISEEYAVTAAYEGPEMAVIVSTDTENFVELAITFEVHF
jgi:hypothetical protein